MKTPSWRLYRNYLFLLPLFAVALVYQGGLLRAVYKGLLHPAPSIVRPFAFDEGTVRDLTPEASKAGLRAGDRVLAINGTPIRGIRPFYDLLKDTSRRSLSVTVPGRTVTVPLRLKAPDPTGWGDITLVLLIVAMSLGCTAVGIYVAFLMPYDVRAIAVFGIMVSISQIVSAGSWDVFTPALQTLAYCYHFLALATWPFWFVLFALYFPQPFSWHRKALWESLILAPVALVSAVFASGVLRPYFALGGWKWIPAIDWRPFISVAIAFFFGAIFTKLGQARAPDARRRLRILVFGAMTGLTPLGLVVAVEAIAPSQKIVSAASMVVVAVIFFVFPLSLGYAVLAERAMRVRVAIRQGIRYALAKGGLRLLTATLIGLVLLAIWNLAFGLQSNRTVGWVVFLTAAVVTREIFARTGHRLQKAIDRRFFRDAYNAEKVLEQLSRKVLTLVRQDDLISTVGSRIMDTLHVSSLAVLLEGDGVLRPVYAAGLDFEPGNMQLAARSSTVEIVKQSSEPPRVYADRRDSWIHEVPREEADLLHSLRSQVLLPVGSQEKLLGLAVLGPKLSEEPYTPSDIQLLTSVMAQTGLALENSRLASAVAEEVAQRERLNREVEIAREVQERLFPQVFPSVTGVDYAGQCRPALGVGGDYYDFLPIADGQLGIAIGDVSGKGIAAALLMASLQASLRGQVLSNPGDLALLMTNVNRLVYDATPINRYATFFYGQYHPKTRVLQYVNAGHNPPFIVRAHAGGATSVIRLDTGGPVVGLLPHAPYQQGAVVLEPGDTFVGYTDGVSEAENPAEDEWGEQQLVAAASYLRDFPASELIPALIARADEFANGAPQHDDMTLIVLKVRNAGSAFAC